jgi:hypothetical protein
VYLQLDEGTIDPALMDQAPGELLPAEQTAGTIASQTETVTEAESESGVMPLEEESKATEGTDHAAGGTEAETAGLVAAQTATTSEAGKQPTFEEMETETTAVEPESVAQAELVREDETAETERVTQPAPEAPEAVNQPRETGESAVLSSGGNLSSSGGFTSFQIILMSASVIWGFVGTALYFSSKRTQDHGHAHDHHH